MTTQSIEQTLEAYKKCHIIISMRLHSMILAIDHHIPFIGISYGQKTAELLSESHWEYAYDIKVQSDTLLNSIQKIESEYALLEKKLETLHSEFQKIYAHNFPLL